MSSIFGKKYKKNQQPRHKGRGIKPSARINYNIMCCKISGKMPVAAGRELLISDPDTI